MPALDIRPRLRGVLHRYAAVGFAVLFVPLFIAADGGGDRLAVAVYGCAVVGMLGVSAVYHSGRLSPAAARRFKRADHAMILVGIAGSYTAVTGLALQGATRIVLLVVVWTAAAIGIAIRMLWLDAPYPLTAAVYLVVGWLALLDLPAYVDGLSGGQMALVVTGGLLYTVGGVVYALHRPRLVPTVFGYHELFHALVVAAALVHYLAVAGLVRSA
ncbi:MAG: PAQR family membrane homeostasis protein TrhA [Acidimicrobiales bacterium]